MRKFVILAALAALAAGGLYLWTRNGDAGKKPATPITALVERGPLRMSVASTGKVVSNLDVEIKCKASGEIVKLPYDVSQEVRKGDLLLELDPAEEQRKVRQSEVALASSEAKLAMARENLAIAERALRTDRQKAEASLKSARARAEDAAAKAERARELLGKKLASREEEETARTTATQAAAELEVARVRLEEIATQEQGLELDRQEIRMAEAQVETDRIALDLARQRLADTKVRAPMDGVVTVRNVQIGQIISSGISNVGGGTTALVLSDLSRMFVLASVDESEIGKVAVDQPVTVTVDAFPGRRFEGRVVRIATRGVNTSNVVTFEVKVEIGSRDRNLLRPEMTANVDILSAEKNDVLKVAADSVFRKGRETFVSLLKADGTREERRVVLGISDGLMTEVVSGLSEGDRVVVQAAAADSRWRGGFPPMMMGGRH